MKKKIHKWDKVINDTSEKSKFLFKKATEDTDQKKNDQKFQKTPIRV